MNKKKGKSAGCRLCVRDFDFKKGRAGPDELFAPTHPLANVR